MHFRHIALVAALALLSACISSVSRSSTACSVTTTVGTFVPADVTGVVGESVKATLKPSGGGCETASPNRATVKIRDPNGDSVEAESDFEQGPANEVGSAKVTATFTPSRPGWYEVTAEFEPNFGRTFLEIFVFAPSPDKRSPEPLGAGSPAACATLEETTSGMLLCDGTVLGATGSSTTNGRTRAVGNTVWLLTANTLTRYDASSGMLTNGATAPSASNGFLELLQASESEVWVSEKDTGTKRFSWTAEGGLVQSAQIPKGAYDARRLFIEGDTLTIVAGGEPGEQMLGTGSAKPGEYTVCEHSLSNLSAAGSCVKVIGYLIGANATEVYSFAETERLLRVLVLEGGHLVPKNSVRVPNGWVWVPHAQSTRNSLGRAAAFTEEPGDLPVLAIPRRTATDGLVLERFENAGTIPVSANERFIWGTDSAGAQLRIIRRSP